MSRVFRLFARRSRTQYRPAYWTKADHLRYWFVKMALPAAHGLPEIHIGSEYPTWKGLSKARSRHLVGAALKRHYSMVINVSDTPCYSFSMQGPVMVWVPVTESGHWGHQPFFAALRALEHVARMGWKRPIYIHCHSGAHRSWVVAYLALRGFGATQTVRRLQRQEAEQANRDVERGHVPDTVLDVLRIARKHPTWALESCTLEILRKNDFRSRYSRVRRRCFERYRRTGLLKVSRQTLKAIV